MALNAYIAQVQSLLHDTGGVFASTSQYTTWVNAGRKRVAADFQAIRQLIPIVFTLNVEVYAFPTPSLTGAASTLGIMSVASPYGNNNKPTLDRMEWTQFQAYLRYFGGSITGFPTVYAEYFNSIYVFPIPFQTINAEADCYLLPNLLATDTDVEAMQYPFTDVVQYYAAYLGLLYAQRYDDASKMLALYQAQGRAANQQVRAQFRPTAYTK
jgi:hypothetical protein